MITEIGNYLYRTAQIDPYTGIKMPGWGDLLGINKQKKPMNPTMSIRPDNGIKTRDK